MSAPNRLDLVRFVDQQYPELLRSNTWESCGIFVQRVLETLDSIEPGVWGHVGKTSGEAQYTPPGFRPPAGHPTVTGFSHDAIFHKPSNRQVDIIANAAANSDPRPEIHGTGRVIWDEINPSHYRPNNPWIPPVSISVEPEPQPHPPPTQEGLEEVLRVVTALSHRVAMLEERVSKLEQSHHHDSLDEAVAHALDRILPTLQATGRTQSSGGFLAHTHHCDLTIERKP